MLHGPAQGFWDGPAFSWNPKYPGSDELGDFSKVKPRHICYGGLTTPKYDGSFNPDGYDGFAHEVGPVYQQGFEGNLARMVEKLGSSAGSILPKFPEPEPTDGKEYYVRVKQLNSTANSVKLSALIVNHSAWPAVMKTNMSFRYYFTKEAGATVTVTKEANTTYPVNGVTVSQPKLASNDVYFIEVTYPNTKIYPGGCKESPDSQLDPTLYPRFPHYEKEVVFTITSSGSWNNSNDWSYAGVGENLSPRGYSRIENIPVLDSNNYLAGKYPPTITSNESFAQSNEITCFPNPAADRLNVLIDDNDLGNIEITIYEVTGTKILSESHNKGSSQFSTSISLRDIEKGIYFVEIKKGTSKTVRKFVKE